MERRIYLLLWIFTTSLAAETVSPDVAQRRAASFLSTQTNTRGAVVDYHDYTLAYTARVDSVTCFYAFNNPRGGFVLIGGDTAANELLGYCTEGSFVYDSLPPSMQWWLEGYAQDIAEASAQHIEAAPTVDTRASAKADIAPLMQTKWGQGYPYNSTLPMVGSERLAVGCVATAAAQIMYTHKRPTQGTGSSTYNQTITALGRSQTVTFTADFGHTQYDWNNMLKSYSGSYTEAQRVAVATLMYHAGVASEMTYGLLTSSGSGAYISKLVEGMRKYFGYDEAMQIAYRSNYNNTQWAEILYNELKEGRPVLYAGYSTFSGHAFVCEGYEAATDMYYFNWGWSGRCDGYFPLQGTVNGKTAFVPSSTSYSRAQHIVLNMKPKKYVEALEVSISAYKLYATEAAIGDVVLYEGLDGNTPRLTSNLTQSTSVTIGARFENINNADDVVNTAMQEVTFSSSPYADDLFIEVPTTLGVGSTYRVVPIFKDNNNEWQPMTLSSDIPLLTITPREHNTLLMEGDLAMPNHGYFTPDHFKCTITLKNATTKTINSNLMLWLVHGTYPYKDISFYNESVSVEANKTSKVTFHIDNLSNISIGDDYYIIIQNASTGMRYVWMQPIYFTQPLNISFPMNQYEWGTLCLPYEPNEIPESLTPYKISAYTEGELRYEEEETMREGYPYIMNGTAGTYTFTGPVIPDVTPTSYGLLTGVFDSNLYAPGGSYVLQYQNSKGLSFYQVEKDNTQIMRAYSAYLTLPLGVCLSPELDTVVDLPQIETATDTTTPRYNLMGQPTKSRGGLTIQNGQLFFMK